MHKKKKKEVPVRIDFTIVMRQKVARSVGFRDDLTGKQSECQEKSGIGVKKKWKTSRGRLGGHRYWRCYSEINRWESQ